MHIRHLPSITSGVLPSSSCCLHLLTTSSILEYATRPSIWTAMESQDQGRRRPKTRTACITCKNRRVKCGEERPHCQRCIKAGRPCEGYQLLVVDGTSSVLGRKINLLPLKVPTRYYQLFVQPNMNGKPTVFTYKRLIL